MNILEIVGLFTLVLVGIVFILHAAGFMKSEIEVTKEEDE